MDPGEAGQVGALTESAAGVRGLLAEVEAVVEEGQLRIVGVQAVPVGADVLVVAVEGGVAEDGLDAVSVLEVLVVGGGVLPLPVGPFVLVADEAVDLAPLVGGAIGVVRTDAEVELREEDLVGAQGQVHVHGRADLQVLPDVVFAVQVADEAVGGPRVVCGFHLVDRVGDVAAD